MSSNKLQSQLAVISTSNNLIVGAVTEMKVLVQVLLDKGIVTADELEAKANEMFGQQSKESKEPLDNIAYYKELPNGQRVYSDEKEYDNLEGYPVRHEVREAGSKGHGNSNHNRE